MAKAPRPPKPEGVQAAPRFKKDRAAEEKPPRHKPLPIVPDTIDALNEMDSGDDRTCAIIGLAFLENNFALAIMTRLRTLDNSEQRELFDEPKSLLSGFSGKIVMGYVLGLYDKKVKNDLICLNTIRNRFAHRVEIRSFDNDEINVLCDALTYPTINMVPRTRKYENRNKYTDTISHLSSRFLLISRAQNHPPPSTHNINDDY